MTIYQKNLLYSSIIFKELDKLSTPNTTIVQDNRVTVSSNKALSVLSSAILDSSELATTSKLAPTLTITYKEADVQWFLRISINTKKLSSNIKNIFLRPGFYLYIHTSCRYYTIATKVIIMI